MLDLRQSLLGFIPPLAKEHQQVRGESKVYGFGVPLSSKGGLLSGTFFLTLTQIKIADLNHLKYHLDS